jgi:hypothetical protein
MTPDDITRTRVESVLMALPRYEPRPESADRVLARCHGRLVKRTRSRPILAPSLASRRRALAKAALAGALGLLYLAAVVGRAFSLYRF